MSQLDLVIQGGKCVLDHGTQKIDIGIKDGKIVKIDSSIEIDGNTEVIAADGLYVLPGVIDSQVHFREPGPTHKEDLETGSLSALMGGVTTFLEMPNTSPPTTSSESLLDKVNRAKEKSYTHFGFFIGGTAENLESLKNAEKIEGCCGIKIFLGSSTGDLLLYHPDKLNEIFAQTNIQIAVHSEDEERLQERIPIRDAATTAHAHPEWRDVESALRSTKRILEIARTNKRKVHVLHISTKEEMEFLAGQKDFCTVEVLPQHLTLFAPDIYDKLGTYGQMNPPIRTKDHQDGLWVGIENGTVDVIGSDHAPHTREEKDLGYPKSPSGMPGVQTLLPVMLDHVNNGRLTLEKLVELICWNPARIYSMKGKGHIKIGHDADFTIIDLAAKHVIKNEDMKTRSGWTPFNDVEMTGKPIMAILDGKIAMKNGNLIDRPHGRPIEFNR